MTAPARRIIGFDRRIRLEWLDAAADRTAAGLRPADVRSQLVRRLEGEVAGGDTPHHARGKTATVLVRVWVRVPAALVPLRDDALALLPGRSGRDRLPLHWGLCLAAYPFFRDVAAATGRLLALQRTASLDRIVRRVTETWGARTSVTRAAPRIVRSFVDWGVLEETGARGVFAPAPRIAASGEEIGPWLLEAGLVSTGRYAVPLGYLLRAPACFPFDLRVSGRDVARRPRLDISRQGREDVVGLAAGQAPALPASA